MPTELLEAVDQAGVGEHVGIGPVEHLPVVALLERARRYPVAALDHVVSAMGVGRARPVAPAQNLDPLAQDFARRHLLYHDGQGDGRPLALGAELLEQAVAYTLELLYAGDQAAELV